MTSTVVWAIVLIAVEGCLLASAVTHQAIKLPIQPQPRKDVAELKKRAQHLEKVIGNLAKQMMSQQTFVEERIRSDGDSGLKQIRYSANEGAKPYHMNTFTGGGVAAVHEHANYDRTVGLGEFIAVMNGVEFRTRHNDYKLRMPSKTTNNYGEMEDLPFPEVPPSVKSKKTVAEQITEMRKYFEAFYKQDKHIRNYEPYFRPVMCYLEGGWTTDTKTFSEPFESDRHFIDASSWFDLQEKVRYTSYTGGKSNNENYSFLPTTIINVTETGQPVYAQWNYRILCHPIRTALKLQDFQLVDDFASRMRSRKNFTRFGRTRAARFSLALRRGRNYDPKLGFGNFTDYEYGGYTLMDRIMYEIPGKDNYRGHMHDNSFDLLKYRFDRLNTTLNSAYYHRFYKIFPKGAKGLEIQHRGFADKNLWVATTTQDKVAKVDTKDCYYDTNLLKTVCHRYESQFTYAVPLEIIWTTPLSKWNPYNFYFHDVRHANDVYKDGRTGEFDKAHAYNGTSRNAYYLTPAEFFHAGEVARDPADTARDTVGVLDQHGNVRRAIASGTRIFMPEIPGVGIIRQRYPIFPAHTEGSTTEKNLAALQDIMMHMKHYPYMFEEEPESRGFRTHPLDTHFVTSTTHAKHPGRHHHDLFLTEEQMHALKRNGTQVHVFTSLNKGHSHEMVLERDPHRIDEDRLKVVLCDGKPDCWDHHGHYVTIRHD